MKNWNQNLATPRDLTPPRRISASSVLPSADLTSKSLPQQPAMQQVGPLIFPISFPPGELYRFSVGVKQPVKHKTEKRRNYLHSKVVGQIQSFVLPFGL